MSKLFLLDAYALIYRSYYAFIKSPRINSRGQNTSAVMGFCNTLLEVLEKEKPDFIAVCFDPHGPTFRSEAFPAYKAQRQATPEDILWSVPVIKRLLEAWRIPTVEVAGFEADDVIGTLATRFGAQGAASPEGPVEVYMLTPDKDYGQLVGPQVYQYRPRHGGGYEVMGVAEVCQKYSISSTGQVVDLLALMGDSADNFPGCPGVGEKTAAKLIADFGSVEQLLQRTGELKGALRKKVEEHQQDIRMSYYLATIRRDVPTEVTLDDLRRREPDLEGLAAMMGELEFRQMDLRIKKLYGAAAVSPQGDLFANAEEAEVGGGGKVEVSTPRQISLFADEGAGETKNRALQTLKSTPHTYHLIEKEEDMREICQKFLAAKTLSLDTETTSTEPLRAQLVGLSFSVEAGEAWYVSIPRHQDKQAPGTSNDLFATSAAPDDGTLTWEEAARLVAIFKPLYEHPAILKVGQNLKYDLEVLARYGIRLAGPMWDTMIAHYLLQPETKHNMDFMAEQLLDYQTIHIDQLLGPRGKQQRNMRDLPPSEVYEYACEDADVTLRLKNALQPLLERQGDAGGATAPLPSPTLRLFNEVEMPLMPVLAEMEQHGVRLDTASLRDTSRQLNERMAALEQEIVTLAGHPLNIASPRQVGQVLFEEMRIVEKPKKTKTGQYVTSEEVLQQLSHQHPIVEKILAHRGLKKLIGTYVDNLPALVNPETGRLHTSFNQCVTATGRLSSSDPNLQNIPVRGEDGKEIRRAFVPEPGQLFFSADYSQIELRVMAHLSQDAHLIEAFRSGHDIHAATAARIYKKSVDDVTRDERSRAKRANFGIIYGITVFGLAERLDIPRAEAKALIDGYFESFPGVRAYMDQCVETAREKGYVETMMGRRRYLPDINSRNQTVRGFAERNAVNAPIQGTAADIIKLAMVRIARRMKEEGLKARLILQVHDELNFTCPPEEKERLQRLVTEEMQGAFPLDVPLVADSGWGNNWLEAH